MYDNSRVPSCTNVSSHPCRVQYNHWSLDTSTTGTTSSQLLSQATTPFSSTSYFSQPQRAQQVSTSHYVNYNPISSPLPSLSSSSSTNLYNYQHPKSTIFRNSTSTNQSILHMNDVRQRSESKAIVGIVKPMIHQRSYIQLNNNNNESKIPEIMLGSYDNNLTRSTYPLSSPTMSSKLCETSPVIYRSRPNSSYNNMNGHPPIVPRRHSSINNNNNKSLSSRRTSRTTSSYENEQQQQQNNDKIIIDIKRLEMFYGSVGTIVKSARSIARLYTTTTRQLINLEDWAWQQRGIPVWIYNTGANLKRTRQVRLLLAQHESCFAIWSNLVSDQAELHLPKDNYITCWLPESNLLVVLQFECNNACRLFFRYYYEILEYEQRMNLTNLSPLSTENVLQQQQQQQTKSTNNTKEIPRRYSRLRTISNKQDKEQQESDLRRCRSLSRIRTVKKSAISGPINFQHINHISGGCNQERPLSSTVTLRSLHASMSHLPTNGTLTDRHSKQSKIRASTVFEPRTTAV
ncbi:unnamed protein product [Rotaria sordida]|uniref:CRIB domain-containing protein n=1 Tax=Rotaria sordida TaxID=392033 RepID=A0A818LTI1_9BILA|nr:unnamed protein product [Rotaria sordida]CAF3577481.1 unnamed protein product [Rotaria sordida]